MGVGRGGSVVGGAWWCSGGMGLWVVGFVWLLCCCCVVCVFSWWRRGFCGQCLVVFGGLCVCVCFFFFLWFLLVSLVVL